MSEMRNQTLRIISLLLISILSVAPASAFEVQPMRHSVFPTSGKTSGLLTVRNTRSEPLPVELIVEKRIYGENSEQTVVRADDDFVIFPFQAVIEPGQSQAFRFQYVGDQTPAEETAYTIHVDEIPVELEKSFSGLRYVYGFGVVVYVEDPEAKSELSIDDIARDGETLSLTVNNSGASFARLNNDRITLAAGESKIDLQGEDLVKVIDKVIVPPNNSAPVKIDLSGLDVPDGEVDVILRETQD